MVPAGSRWISRVPRYSGADSTRYATSLTGLSPSAALLPRSFCCRSSVSLSSVLQPRLPRRHGAGLGYSAFARHYLHYHFCFLFLRVMRCFSSPGSPCAPRSAAITRGGLPHSEIRGSAGICPSPRLIAACHVLLRLQEPRHPSCALFSFPFSFCRSSQSARSDNFARFRLLRYLARSVALALS